MSVFFLFLLSLKDETLTKQCFLIKSPFGFEKHRQKSP